jgi:hypothetical protein
MPNAAALDKEGVKLVDETPQLAGPTARNLRGHSATVADVPDGLAALI